MPETPLLYSNFFPRRKALCLCGSDLRFKSCCGPELLRLFTEHQGPLIPTPDPIGQGTPQQRLRRARVCFSHYWVWHTAHRAWSPSEESYATFLDIDLRAMCDHIEGIVRISHELMSTAEVLKSLERLRDAVRDPRWPDYIAYLRAITWLYPDWSEIGEQRAMAEFRAIDLRRVDSVEVLQVHLHLFGDTLGLSDRLWEVERIIELSTVPSHKLQYRMVRALTLEYFGDSDGAISGMIGAVAEYERGPMQEDGYSLLQYGRALVQVLRHSSSEIEPLLSKAQQAFQRVIGEHALSAAFRAGVELDRGLAYAVAKRWEEALQAYGRSQQLQFSPRASIYMAESLAQLDRSGEARGILYSLDYESLPDPLKFDHCLSLALAADLSRGVAGGDCELLETRFGNLKVPYPVLADSMRHILGRIDGLKIQELRDEVAKLRSAASKSAAMYSDDGIRSALSARHSLPPTRQTQTLPVPMELPAFLAEITVHACSQLLDQRQLLAKDAASQEDVYTAYIVSLLQQRVADYGWSVADQRLGGLPSKDGPERGRRDVAFWKGADAPFCILEALRCSSMGKTGADSVDEHLHRLVLRYDQCGSATPILVVFAEVVDFSSFCTKFMEHLARGGLTDIPLTDGPRVDERWKANGLIRRSIKMYGTSHGVRGADLSVTHIVVHVPSS